MNGGKEDESQEMDRFLAELEADEPCEHCQSMWTSEGVRKGCKYCVIRQVMKS